MDKFRFHVVGLPHTQATKDYLPCAYTQKVLNFCKMMKSLGHEVYHYGGEGSDPDIATEHISIISNEQRKKFWGHNDWKTQFFDIQWDANLPYWRAANLKAIGEIASRIQDRDFICLIGGNCQKPIADAFPNHMSVEFGIGYSGVFSKYRVFESYAWMHTVYGELKQGNGSNYDAVIPNYFDPVDFPFSDKKDDYYLFVGRMISRKGIETAVETTRRLGAKLIIAGQGVLEKGPGYIKTAEMTITGDHVEHVGTVGVKDRGELMSKAKALFVPTTYIGPFEGVHAEALLCGTPVLTTDYGVFTETVDDGIDGFRCRTLGEFVAGAKLCSELDYELIRRRAMARFSTDVVKYRYLDYFLQLSTLWGQGWYDEKYTGKMKRTFGGF